ncbi:MAG: DUF4113 domain-containing protein [Flavobacterium sp.]
MRSEWAVFTIGFPRSYANPFAFSLPQFANQSLGRQWKMKQEKLSKSYTTRIDEIITIKI